MLCDFKQIPGDGLYYRQRRIANAIFQIEAVYEDVQSEAGDICAVEVDVTIAGLSPRHMTLSLDELNYRTIHQAVPLLSIANQPSRALLDVFLADSVVAFIQDKTGSEEGLGKYYRENGCHRMQDGTWFAAEGAESIGGSPHFLANPDVRQLHIASSQDSAPVCRILKLLQEQPSILLLLLSYTHCSLIRSAILDAGIDFHAVAWLFGRQGFGKSTAAKRTAGFVVPQGTTSGKPALFYDCSSSISAVREALTVYRDWPVILDDICFSAGKASQEKRQELAAEMLRECANDAEIIRKIHGQNVRLRCAAGVILTAEFPFGSDSDVTRCIMMKLTQRLSLPETYTAALSGSVAKEFLHQFLQKADQYLWSLTSQIRNPPELLRKIKDVRVRTNLTALKWSFEILLDAAINEGVSPEKLSVIRSRFNRALDESLATTADYLKELHANDKEGNLAYILVSGIYGDRFRLLDSMDTVDEYLASMDGVYLPDGKQSDFVFLRKAPLLTFVKQQRGYQNYTIKQITNELASCSALSCNEAGTFQIKISGKKKVPRVYRISLSALQRHAKKYETVTYDIIAETDPK